MSEDYLERRRRRLNEDHKFRRAQSKRDIEILKGKLRIDEGKDAGDHLAAEIRRRERSEKLKALLDEMQKQKAYVLERIAACSSAHKDKWSERLLGIDLTHPGAAAELKDLCEEVEEKRRVWSDKPFTPPAMPEWCKRLTGIDGWMSITSESTEKGRPSTPPDAVELRWEQEQNDRERARKLIEGDLALVVSLLGVLISTRNQYESALSKV